MTPLESTRIEKSLAYAHDIARREIAVNRRKHYTAFSTHDRMTPLLRISFNTLLLLTSLFLGAQPVAAKDWTFNNVERVVAIADIHGAYDAMVSTLQSADILGDELQWSGGQSHLVIVGDILDRGPKSRAAMDLLMRLEGEAEAAGGRVHVLIGNHESMLLTGDMRYVSAEEYAAFASEEDLDERAQWFEHFVVREGGDPVELRQRFDENFPVGYFAMRRSFRADGQYGRWLLTKSIIAVINGTAFVHGGLPPMVAEIGLDGINGDLQKGLVQYVETLNALMDARILLPTDSHYNYEQLLNGYRPPLSADVATLNAVADGVRLSNLSLISTSGPLWYRNNTMCPAIVEEHRIDAALAAIGANRVVIGHSPTPNRKVMQRFDGRVIEIDTGMLNFYYRGMGHALVLQGEEVSVVNQSGVMSDTLYVQPRNVGRRPDGLTALKLEEFLEQGEILSVEKVVAGSTSRTMVTVQQGERKVRAIFNKLKSKGFYPNVAAYRLDRELNLEMVPVTVIRNVDGKDGSLQFAPGNTIDEGERSATGRGGDAWCTIPEQWPAMYVFDVLAYNEGRSQSRMLYDTSSWRLILSEHERAFANKKGRPRHLKNAPIAVSQGWKNALGELTDERVDERFSDVLDKRRLRALKSRRDELLATP